jgi:pimeloyl-ACP methyl ester carboxylesterase
VKNLELFFIVMLLPSSLFAMPVHEQTFLDVGGNTKVYLEVSGPRKDAPLLLYVHGGPANVVLGLLPFQMNVGKQLEKDFLVAYLHQRGAGKSPPIQNSSQETFADYVDDLDKVVAYLLGKYRQGKVHLVGHSIGGMMAVMYAENHKNRVAKIVLISTAMNVRSMLRDGYDSTLAWAKEEKMTQAIADLERVDQKFETWQDFIGLSKWANQARGGVLRRVNMEQFLRDNNIDRDYPNWGERMSRAAVGLSQELMSVDLESAASSLHIPALFVSGALDTIVTERTVHRDYEQYEGDKEFVLLKDSHHLSFIDQPDELAHAIDRFLLK